MSRLLADLKGPEIPELVTERSTVILPMGAVEQHGPHLPLNVDLTMATSYADAVVKTSAETNSVTAWYARNRLVLFMFWLQFRSSYK